MHLNQSLAFWCMVVCLLHRECFERALKIHEKLYGHKHPSVATVLGNLGNLWEKEGDKAKAISLYQEALAIQEEIHGPNHLKVSHQSVIRISVLQYPMLGRCQQAWAVRVWFGEQFCTRVALNCKCSS